jgi:hypothetical protein
MPSVYNKSPFVAQVLPLIDAQGRNVAVVIVKGTFGIGKDRAMHPVERQNPILFSDEFVAEPGQSDVRVPSDLIDFKPASDVLLIRPKPGLDEGMPPKTRVSIAVGPVRVSGPLDGSWQFGPVRRDEKSRRKYAGTFDQDWIENRMPLLPEDFDPRHNQAASPNQQVRGYLRGDESVSISNLYSQMGSIETNLPGLTIVVAGNVRNQYFTEIALLDTVLILTDRPELTLVWRYAIRPKQKIEEVRNVYIYRARLQSVREVFGRVS